MTGRVDLDVVRARLAVERRCQIGFPVARDVDFSGIAWVHEEFVNNLGTPGTPTGRWPVHTKDLEREVIATHAALYGGSAADPGATSGRVSGYVTAGGSSEGLLQLLWLARQRHPDARVYHSAATHFSTLTAADVLGLPTSVVGVDDGDEVLYEQLGRAVAAHPDRAAVVVATWGTTMTEAVDDVVSIHDVLDEAGVERRLLVVDAALSGPALAACGDHGAGQLLDGHARRVFGIVNSTHKSWACPHVGAVALWQQDGLADVGRPVDYLADTVGTVSGSRPGQSPVELWHAWNAIGGVEALARRARAARELATYTVARLLDLGVHAWRHDHAWTVVLDPPSIALCRRWSLPESGGRAHLICMPGVTRELIDEFLGELAAERAVGRRQLPTRFIEEETG